MHPEYIFLAFSALGVLFLIWRFFRSGGSLAGALLGGTIEKECGAIDLGSGSFHSQRLEVYAMRTSAGEPFVGIALVHKAPFGVSMIPFKLTQIQARELAALLTQVRDSDAAC